MLYRNLIYSPINGQLPVRPRSARRRIYVGTSAAAQRPSTNASTGDAVKRRIASRGSQLPAHIITDELRSSFASYRLDSVDTLYSISLFSPEVSNIVKSTLVSPTFRLFQPSKAPKTLDRLLCAQQSLSSFTHSSHHYSSPPVSEELVYVFRGIRHTTLVDELSSFLHFHARMIEYGWPTATSG